MVLVAKINAIAKGNDEQRAVVLQKAKDNFLDPKWFFLVFFCLFFFCFLFLFPPFLFLFLFFVGRLMDIDY